MIHSLQLNANDSVQILEHSTGREYAQVNSTPALTAISVSWPTNPSTTGSHLESHADDWIYKVDDTIVATDAAGITYWGVVDKRKK